jgi:hypothetical protein
LFSFFICCYQHQRKTICLYVFTQPFLWRLHKLNRSDVAQFILFDFRFSSSACIHLNNICVILKRSTITIECRGSIRVSTVHGHKAW